MLKKIGYFYLAVAAFTILLALGSVAVSLTGGDSDLLWALVMVPLMFLFLTSPIWLLLLALIVFKKPLRRLLTQAEHFHSGDN
jgi:hypothetical protein